MKKLVTILLILILAICTCVATSETAVVMADPVFHSASAMLSTRKDVSFDFSTTSTVSYIMTTRCWLQKKTGNYWIWVKELEAPAVIATNTAFYGAFMDYSADIGTGTYRVGYTAKADGHSITRYTNSRTFD